MRRVLVAGARGAFGRLIRSRLAERGIETVAPAFDVEDRASLDSTLRPGDVLVDAAGPFQRRTVTLVEAAIRARCDVVDIADALDYAERVLRLDARARAAGVRVFSACSAVAAVAGACVREIGIAAPERVDIFLAPAARVTAGGATARSFISSVGVPIRVWEDSTLRGADGWRRSRPFPRSRRRGREVESAAALLLPHAWPTLRAVGFWVDPNVPLSWIVLPVLARVPVMRAVVPMLFPLARLIGSTHGVFAVQVEGEGRVGAMVLEAERRSQLIAAEPAVMAVEAILAGSAVPPGIVATDRLVDQSVFARLRAAGIVVSQEPTDPRR